MRAELCGRQFGLCGYFVALLRFKKLWLVDMFVVLKDHVTCFFLSFSVAISLALVRDGASGAVFYHSHMKRSNKF